MSSLSTKKPRWNSSHGTRLSRAMAEKMILLTCRFDFEAKEANFTILGIHAANPYNIKLCCGESTCTCIDFQNEQLPCKHLLFVLCRILDDVTFAGEIHYSEHTKEIPLRYAVHSATNIDALFRGCISRISPSLIMDIREETRITVKRIRMGESSSSSSVSSVSNAVDVAVSNTAEIIDLTACDTEVKSNEIEVENSCPICFEMMEICFDFLELIPYRCEQCKKIIHAICIMTWKKHGDFLPQEPPTCPCCRAKKGFFNMKNGSVCQF